MAYEHKDGKGSLFKNDKGDNPKRPDLTGSIKIEGVVWRLSAWTERNDDGSFKRLSINAELPKDSQGAERGERSVAANPARTSPAHPSRDMDDSIPF